MKLKIFNKALFTLMGVMATWGAFAQKRTDSIKQIIAATPMAAVEPMQAISEFSQPMAMTFGTQDTTYNKEYRKLQQQMNELRGKMSKLRTDEMQKNTRRMQELSRKMTDKSFESLKNFQYHFDENNVSGLSKGMGVSSNSFSFSGSKGDDYIRKKIESGEAKEKTKTYSKSYPVDNNDNISIDNSYGKVTVNTWAKNEIKVDVQIRAVADDDAKAQKLLDGVTISDSKSASNVSFKTNIDNDVDGMWSGNNHVRKTEVNYIVYMPAKSPIVIKNRFGGIKVPDLSGKVKVDLAYGTLNAEQLTNPQNEISVKFGEARIENLNSASVNVSYGNMNIGTADNLNAKLSFSGGNVDRLKTAGDISVKYGRGLKVGQLVNLKNLNVDASFTKVLVNVKDDCNFDVNTKMGNFTYDDNDAVKVTEATPASDRGYSSAKSYKGTVGKGSAAKTITIKSSYGSVKFDKPDN